MADSTTVARKRPEISGYSGGQRKRMNGKVEKPGSGYIKPHLAEENITGPYGKSKHRGGGQPNQDAWRIKKSGKRPGKK